MSNKIVVNDGKLWFGSLSMQSGHPKIDGNVKVHLFSNNYTIVRGSALGDLTEISYPGYAAQTLSGVTDGGIDGSHFDTWTWPTVTFQATGTPGSPVTAYGYYVTDSAVTKLLWAENFATPQVFTNSGDGFTIGLTFSFGSIYGN